MSLRYQDAGIHLDLAEEITARITARIGSGLFGGFVSVSALKAYESPVLVSSIDGIGTKVRLAARLGLHPDTIRGLGRDIVHHCVNDIAVHGASPLFFLDYLAFNRLDPLLVDGIVSGIAEACDALNIALAGGETAEMPLVYPPGHFDIAGAIVGVVEQAQIVDGTQAIVAGDAVIAFPSSGLHTNGYSLVQQLFADEDYRRHEPMLGATLGEALLEPHRCYLDVIRSLIEAGRAADPGAPSRLHGLAHITGGGIEGNLSRIMPSGLQAVIELPPPPPLFAYLQARGVPADEMPRVFNMGIGMIAVCDASLLPEIESEFEVLGTVKKKEDCDS